MSGVEDATMADEYRALLTEREQEILAGDADVSESYYYRVVTRVRRKVERIERDLQVLDEHHDTLAGELREIVCRAEGGEPQAGPPADVLDAVDAADLPGTVDRGDAAAAVAAARDHIRDRGGATMQDLVKNVMPDHPLGYDVDAAFAKIGGSDRYRGGWWRNVVKPGLKALDDVQTPSQSASTWRYTGEASVDK